jgi:hypothetical protein
MWPWLPNVVAHQAFDYAWDSWQRSVLYLDILRERGNRSLAHNAERVPHVLHYNFELVMSGRTLEHPVNYALVRIVPPADVAIDDEKRPFIVFDPRAGHGPGIGGMKHDSEIGVALAAGHPCYFVGFLPAPVPGQTIEDVCHAEAAFVRKVIELHPSAEGRPYLIGNCQAGWQIAMMAGVHGQGVMRYLGGLFGGSWLTSLLGDLGNGIFDGAYLIGNFEALEPANTYWQKGYNVYSKADTEGPRYLDFETWWGSPVLLTAPEIQTIVDELFVGNRLSSGDMRMSNGDVIDLRNIKSPIVVFCSFGDNITPPQQALGWILDLYGGDDEITSAGQTIIYVLHQTVGHLGIFVSAKVATKEHRELQQGMDIIDVLPPGLYEAVFEKKTSDTAGHELVSGDWVLRFEPRSLADLRALGTNDEADDLRFATLARLSEVTQGLYRSFLSPTVQSFANENTAEWLRRLHPSRLRYELLSDKNPLLQSLATVAEHVTRNRRPVDNDNAILRLEQELSKQIVRSLDLYRDTRDSLIESWFMAVYGAPLLQALMGLRADAARMRRQVARDATRNAVLAKSTIDVDMRLEKGGIREAGIRALLYIGLGQEIPAFDERGFAILRDIRANTPAQDRVPLSEFKEIVRDQYALIRADKDRAMAALPKLLPRDAGARQAAFDLIRRIVSAKGEPAGEVKTRLDQVEALFDIPNAIQGAVSERRQERRSQRAMEQHGGTPGKS